jgi:hypothetical protein
MFEQLPGDPDDRPLVLFKRFLRPGYNAATRGPGWLLDRVGLPGQLLLDPADPGELVVRPLSKRLRPSG